MEENIKVETIDQYLELCSKEIQPKLRMLRKIIMDTSEELTEKISWQMPTFYFKGNVIHFAAHKKHIGLYCGAKAVNEFSERLEKYKTHNGTIQLPNDSDLDANLIQDIVKFGIEMNKNK